MNGYEDENSYGENGDSDEEEFRKRVSNKRRPSGMLNLSNKDAEALRYLYHLQHFTSKILFIASYQCITIITTFIGVRLICLI